MSERKKNSLKHWMEYILFRIFFALIGLLPVDTASNLGGWLGRTLGPALGISRKARKNIAHALPELSAERRQEILVGMWDNLGRVLFEYPHLPQIVDPAENRIVYENEENLKEVMDDPDKGAIFAAGHLSNWEVVPLSAGARGIPLTIIVRSPNNRLVAGLVDRIRNFNGVKTTPKGPEAAKTGMRVIRSKSNLGILFDQRLSDGIRSTLFGKPAETATAHVVMTLGGRAAILPVESHRTGPGRFRITLHKPVRLENTGQSKEELIRDGVQLMNDHLEQWIRNQPEDWLWLHRRFPR
ncbi:lysophospholipid acyltransferase family protein [Kiloniella sp. b19]|uniref:lysophospholipid acyltransferase family protein n=1 Tax=Kiloniella sp. GXU_MW_B19 TaxID=3141326 RepID=UPI0031D3C8BC